MIQASVLSRQNAIPGETLSRASSSMRYADAIQDGIIGTGKHKTALFMKKRDYAILFRPTQGSPEFGLARARQHVGKQTESEGGWLVQAVRSRFSHRYGSRKASKVLKRVPGRSLSRRKAVVGTARIVRFLYLEEPGKFGASAESQPQVSISSNVSRVLYAVRMSSIPFGLKMRDVQTLRRQDPPCRMYRFASGGFGGSDVCSTTTLEAFFLPLFAETGAPPPEDFRSEAFAGGPHEMTSFSTGGRDLRLLLPKHAFAMRTMRLLSNGNNPLMETECQTYILNFAAPMGTSLRTQMDGLGSPSESKAKWVTKSICARHIRQAGYSQGFLTITKSRGKKEWEKRPASERQNRFPAIHLDNLPYPYHRLAGHPVTPSFMSCFFPSADTNASLARPPINQPQDCVPSQEITSFRVGRHEGAPNSNLHAVTGSEHPAVLDSKAEVRALEHVAPSHRLSLDWFPLPPSSSAQEEGDEIRGLSPHMSSYFWPLHPVESKHMLHVLEGGQSGALLIHPLGGL
ncbi:uncharacterized protein CLUP02_07838 [Colletotrichum lupini]|uniref:Uncharacterized protein n=1 Tax=Colletotrichum lupini TaxID=145971 RepID=A0A9Q8SRZ9_9PEZI|nr:uncharacterized protein CLUP02_07838 [Colletotrichum lupini]UQC82350.1 hypothetical protein CLUP02_07838 [Colletotrichum lupini]